MAVQYSTTHRTNAMTQLATDIGSSAQIMIYTGSPPANVGTAPTGTLLVQFAGNAAGFGSASGGVLTAAAVANANAGGTGTAGYFRINTSGGTAVMQGTITTTGGGGDMTTANTSIASGQTCTFTSFTVTAFGA